MTGPDPAAGLYEVEPDAFVAARNRLAKELRADGRREEAERVARLRRPPPSAWALNQVARHRPGLIDAVLDAGADLRRAVGDALGGDASGVREAQAAERRAVDAAVGAAAAVLEGAGRTATDAVRLRIAADLRAAVVDASVAELVRAGTLDADRDPPGFALDGASVASRPAAGPAPTAGAGPAPGPRAGPEAGPGPAAAERRRLAAEADEAEDGARRLERQSAEAERRAQQVAGAAAEAAAEAEAASERAGRLAAESRAAADRARAARARAEAADAHAREARRRADAGPATSGTGPPAPE
ncbi:MAG TPA: hypothetical protein VM263_10340 [Acidimicrobiales bacterium]|nr:hypothetical protein [Acidimicrobiales bacterium]